MIFFVPLKRAHRCSGIRLSLVVPTGRLQRHEEDHADVTWQVVREKPNEKGEYELVTEVTSAKPKIMLREGKYLLIARFGEMWGKENLNITAGEVAKIKVKLVKDTNVPVIASRNGRRQGSSVQRRGHPAPFPFGPRHRKIAASRGSNLIGTGGAGWYRIAGTTPFGVKGPTMQREQRTRRERRTVAA